MLTGWIYFSIRTKIGETMLTLFLSALPVWMVLSIVFIPLIGKGVTGGLLGACWFLCAGFLMYQVIKPEESI
jgi:hypothetical protein